MPIEITLRGPTYTFQCYGLEEAKRLGWVDAFRKPGLYAPVSSPFGQGEGKLLADWVERLPDALLVVTSRYQITVFRPKVKLREVPDEEEVAL